VIIKIILLTALMLLALYAVSQRHKSRPVAGAMLIVTAAGAIFVANPELTNIIARLVGVSRGADLTLYCFVLIIIFAIFNIHLRMRAAMEQTTILARQIAILSAILPTKHNNDQRGDGCRLS
jgi:small membrane protein